MTQQVLLIFQNFNTKRIVIREYVEIALSGSPKDNNLKGKIQLLERTKHTRVWVDRTFCAWEDTLSAPQVFDVTGPTTPGSHTITVRVNIAKLPPLDPEGNRLLYTVKFVNEVASLPGLPPIDYVSQFIGEAVKTGLNTYEYTVVCYAAVQQDEPGQRRGQVRVIAMITGRAELLGPDHTYDTQMYKWFTVDQDADPADGFPDAGQEPILTLGPFAGDTFTRVPLVSLPEVQ